MNDQSDLGLQELACTGGWTGKGMSSTSEDGGRSGVSKGQGRARVEHEKV